MSFKVVSFVTCIFFTSVLYFQHSVALPEGAPVGACTAMRPMHEDRANGGILDPQMEGTSPYSVMVSATTYTRNTAVTGELWI